MPTLRTRATHRCSRALLGLAIGVLTGCTGAGDDVDDDFADGSRTTMVDGREVFVAEHPPCDDTNACRWSIVIDGVSFEPSGDCVEDAPDQSDLIAVGDEDDGGDRFFDREGNVLVGGSAVSGSPDCSWMVLEPSSRHPTNDVPGA